MQRTKAGDRYGLWTVVRLPEKFSRLAWCRCKCGTEKFVNLDNVRQGKTLSCGCRRPEWSKRAGRSRVRQRLIIGQQFGRLTVVKIEDRGHVTCQCSCGTEKIVPSGNLFAGNTQSCGCLAAERRRWPDGAYRHSLFQTWSKMVRRCDDPRDSSHSYYGARGIRVCEQWKDLTVFIADIEATLGPRPAGMTLDRYPDNDGNYEPGNVRWATAEQQTNNRRPSPRGWHDQRDPVTCIYCGRKGTRDYVTVDDAPDQYRCGSTLSCERRQANNRLPRWRRMVKTTKA